MIPRQQRKLMLLENAILDVINEHVPPQNIKAFLQEKLWHIEDDTLCLDECKGMYFCLLKKGHAGAHKEGALGALRW